MEFARLVEIMKRLRAPGGCPWDREQTAESLKPYLVEEVYEVLDALEKDDADELCSELGDLLLQIVFHAQIAAERNLFAIDDVIAGIVEKMVRRHPHVFGDVSVSSTSEVLRNWSRIKSAERKNNQGADHSALAGLPRSLPALIRAQRIGEKAARSGLDWTSASEVLAKVAEELKELTEAHRKGSAEAAEEELGDLLFALASFARLSGLSAELALRRAVDKFESRFRKLEQTLAAEGKEILELDAEELETRWQEAKRRS